MAHVLQLDFGLTCAAMKRAHAKGGANIRVQELFDRCSDAAEVVECPTMGEGLVFVSAPSSFRGRPVRIRNVKKKHVGLLLNGTVWLFTAIAALILFFALFPTGSFVPRALHRYLPWLLALVAAGVAAEAIDPLRPAVRVVVYLIETFWMGSMLLVQLYRYVRVSTPAERRRIPAARRHARRIFAADPGRGRARWPRR